MNYKRWLIAIILLVILITTLFFITKYLNNQENISVEDIRVEQKIVDNYITTKGNSDIIKLDTLISGDTISSPLEINGKARGPWYFEASFPVILTNWDGLIIASSVAQAQGEWMTNEFVPFQVRLEFETNSMVNKSGSLILRKNNPSGLPEYDDSLEIPIFFK